MWLGIDIGTSATKAVLLSEEGSVAGVWESPYDYESPRPGWTEQDPALWWSGTIDAVRNVLGRSGVPGRAVLGIGLSGQMHGLVLLDGAGEVLRPAILWNDQRTARECEEITERVGLAELRATACNPPLAGFTAPKILWVRRHEPACLRKARHVLLPKDYVRFRMSGSFATEVSDASGTLLLDVPARKWSDLILSRLDIDRELLPPCHESTEVTAKLSAQAAEALGLEKDVPIAGGGGDQAAGAVGAGIVRPGLVSATLGTSGVVFASTDRIEVDPQGRLHTFCHAVPGRWHLMGVMLSAGGALQWYRNALEQVRSRRAVTGIYDVLIEEAANVPPGSEGLFFLPYLTGERTPHADPYARGGWIGITPRTTRAALLRSLLEGVTFGMKDSLELMRAMRIEIEEIRLSGGGARSRFWRQLQADIYGVPVQLCETTEGPALGAAILASVGTGFHATVEEACDAVVRTRPAATPSEDARKRYEAQYALFRKLYPALRQCFREIHEGAGAG